MKLTREERKKRHDDARDQIGRLARYIYCDQYKQVGINVPLFDELDEISKNVWREIGTCILANREARRLYLSVLSYEWESKGNWIDPV